MSSSKFCSRSCWGPPPPLPPPPLLLLWQHIRSRLQCAAGCHGCCNVDVKRVSETDLPVGRWARRRPGAGAGRSGGEASSETVACLPLPTELEAIAPTGV